MGVPDGGASGTVFTKVATPGEPPTLSKRISIGTDGQVFSDGSACRMAAGIAWNIAGSVPGSIRSTSRNSAIQSSSASRCLRKTRSARRSLFVNVTACLATPGPATRRFQRKFPRLKSA